MKRLLTLMAVLLLSYSAQAKLHDIMKDLGKNFKAVGKQVTDPSKNQNTLALVRDMESLLADALEEIPETVAELPVDQQEAKQVEYKLQINGTLLLAQQLEKALLANDNSAAAKIAGQMSAARKKGHDEFRKKEDL